MLPCTLKQINTAYDREEAEEVSRFTVWVTEKYLYLFSVYGDIFSTHLFAHRLPTKY